MLALIYSHSEEPITRAILDLYEGRPGFRAIPLKFFLDNLRVNYESSQSQSRVRWFFGTQEFLSNDSNTLMINRITSVPLELFRSLKPSDRYLAQQECQAYLSSALNAFPKAASKTTDRGLVADHLSLPHIWAKSQDLVRTPKYYYGPGNRMDFSLEPARTVFSSLYDYFNWQPGVSDVPVDTTVFAFERPVGNPVFALATPREILLDGHVGTDVSHKAIELAKALRIRHGHWICEILFFVDQEEITLGVVNPFPKHFSKNRNFNQIVRNEIDVLFNSDGNSL